MEEQRDTGRRTAGSQDEDAEAMERLEEEIRNLPVSDHVLYMMHSLSALAVGRLGLTPDTAGRRDLEQARLAIDCFRALMDTVARARPSEENTIHRGTLSQLQLAYLEALEAEKREGGSPGEASAAAVSTDETPVEQAATDETPAEPASPDGASPDGAGEPPA